MVSDPIVNYATGTDLKSSESLDIKNELDTVSGQDSNTLVQNEIDMEDGVQQDSANDLEVVALDTKAKEVSEEVALGHSNNGTYCSVLRVERFEKRVSVPLGTFCINCLITTSVVCHHM